MARDLPGNISNLFESVSTGVYTAFPCAGSGVRNSAYFSAWIFPDVVNIDHWVISASDSAAGTTEGVGLRLSNTNIQMVRQQGAAKLSQVGTVGSGSWQHVFGSWGSTASDNSAVYLDGGTPGTDATNKNPAAMDFTTIGAISNGSGTLILPFNGKIAEVAIWDLEFTWAALNSGVTIPTDVPATAKEVEMVSFLAEGASPAFFPAGLVSYWKMDELSGGLRDSQSDGKTGGGPNNLAEVGTVAYFDHPKIHYPGQVTYSFPVAGGAPPVSAQVGRFGMQGGMMGQRGIFKGMAKV